jgi:Apea-like HEPN
MSTLRATELSRILKVYKVEYLITVDQKESFCKTVAGFNNLIKTIDGVSISSKDLKLGALSISYEVQTGEIQNDKQRFFHVRLLLDNEAHLPEFEVFLKSIRTLLHKAGGKPPHVLWDGLSFNYAQTAYPIVHEIENTMRKLITKFMLINVGLGWAKEAVPREVLDSVRSKDTKLDHNYLYEVDFIQLSNFLFKEYATVNPSTLIEKVRKANNIADLDLNELKLSIPKSNWDRFFSKVVKCESEYLKIRWDRLHERRNQIAHNRSVSKFEFDEICTLRDELAPKLQQAIEGLDQVTISEDDRDLLSENVATTKSAGYGEFFTAWNSLNRELYILASMLTNLTDKNASLVSDMNNVRTLINIISKKYNVMSPARRREIQNLVRIRNYLVYEPDVIVPTEVLAKYMASAIDCTNLAKSKTAEVVETGIAPIESAIENTPNIEDAVEIDDA